MNELSRLEWWRPHPGPPPRGGREQKALHPLPYPSGGGAGGGEEGAQ